MAGNLAASPVSRQSQIIPRIDTSGSEATNAAKPGLFRAISEISAMISADMIVLVAK
jgi:hypothetical protein